MTTAAAGTNTCSYITTANRANAAFVGNRTAGNCSGDLNQGSFLIDYAFNKHLDMYAGVTFSEINGGLASGFLENNDTTFTTGLRVKW